MKVLIIDNYDSFTYNLYQYVGEILEEHLGASRYSLKVLRNDEIDFPGIAAAMYERIIISPGPGNPSDEKYFGVCKDVILNARADLPVLGVCLGMQGMGHYLGGEVVKARLPMHGKTSKITHKGTGIFAGLPQGIEVMRYHSLVVKRDNLPAELEITAEAGGEIMGLHHRSLPMAGVQFHPESFATEGGKQILTNFLFNT